MSEQSGHGITEPVIPIGNTTPVDAQGHRRTHRITPWVHGLRVLPSLIAFMVIFGVNGLADLSDELMKDPDLVSLNNWITTNAPWLGSVDVLAVIVFSAVLVLLVTFFRWIAWQRLTYWFDSDGDLRVDSGVLSRHQRRLQLSRLQTVDVVQPLVARVFGMCELRIEVAGTGDSRAVLQYLSATEATALRSEILARAAGVRPDAGEAPENALLRVPSREFILSLLLLLRVWLSLVFLVVMSVGTFTFDGTAGLVTFLSTSALPLLVLFIEFNNYYGFTVAESPDGVRLRHGLLQTYAQTVPPGRVQAISIVQPFFWRKRDWVRVKINLAGVGASENEATKQNNMETLLVPVAPRAIALGLISRVLPGVDIDAIELMGVQARVARRSPVQWSALAVGWNDQVFVTRRGRISRHLSIIPHARTQSVRVTQGPWERALGLASMHVDSTPGPVKVVALHRVAAEARMIADEQAHRARQARLTDGPARWASKT